MTITVDELGCGPRIERNQIAARRLREGDPAVHAGDRVVCALDHQHRAANPGAQLARRRLIQAGAQHRRDQGWLPMPGGEREAFLTADYNAEMTEQIARYPRVRDRAIFVGDPADIIPGTVGPGLPPIRDWTEQHYDFSGYITGFDPSPARRSPRAGLPRRRAVCIVTAGGSGVGQHLLRKVIVAYPEARDRVAGLRMIVVAGPRIDPGSLPACDGLEIRPYVHQLYQHLAACELVVVQGGLTTAMELTAARGHSSTSRAPSPRPPPRPRPRQPACCQSTSWQPPALVSRGKIRNRGGRPCTICLSLRWRSQRLLPSPSVVEWCAAPQLARLPGSAAGSSPRSPRSRPAWAAGRT